MTKPMDPLQPIWDVLEALREVLVYTLERDKYFLWAGSLGVSDERAAAILAMSDGFEVASNRLHELAWNG